MTAQAASTIYLLSNHPDGNAAAPFYGLRLDELYDVTNGNDVWTFDFDAPESDMRLVYDDNDTNGLGDDTVRIFGTVFGGLDVGSSFDSDLSGVFAVDFLYTTNFVSGLPEVEITESVANSGTIDPLFNVPGFADGPIDLFDLMGNNPFSFRFNNTENHRLGGSGLSGPDVFVGYGWMNHVRSTTHCYRHWGWKRCSKKKRVGKGDWLFTARVIPEPGTGLLVGAGLLGLAAHGRRRR